MKRGPKLSTTPRAATSLYTKGLRALTALLVPREKAIRSLLAASTRPQPHSKLPNPTPIDQHYENLRVGMRGLFIELAWPLKDRQFIFHPFG